MQKHCEKCSTMTDEGLAIAVTGCDYCGCHNKSSAKEFADTIKDNPKKAIAWAKNEIKEYEKLIKILENNK